MPFFVFSDLLGIAFYVLYFILTRFKYKTSSFLYLFSSHITFYGYSFNLYPKYPYKC